MTTFVSELKPLAKRIPLNSDLRLRVYLQPVRQQHAERTLRTFQHLE
jgi:hypothetical protein